DSNEESHLLDRCRASAAISSDTDVIAFGALVYGMTVSNISREGLASLEKSLSVLHSVDDQSVPLHALYTLTTRYHLMEDERQALKLAQELRTLGRTLRIGRAELNAHERMLGIYFEQNYWSLALQEGRAAVRLAEWAGDKAGLVSAHINLGACQIHVGQRDAAAAEYQRALTAASGEGGSFVSLAAANLVQVLLDLDRVPEAAASAALAVQQARTSNSWTLSRALMSRSHVAFAQKRFDIAYDDAAEAIAVGRGQNENLESEALAAEADALACLDRVDDARAIFHRAISKIEARTGRVGEKEARAQFFSDHRSAYLSMIRVLAENGEFTEALWLAERATARVLLGAIKDISSDPMLLLSAEQKATLASLNQRIQQLNGKLIHGSEADQPLLAVRLNELRDELARFRILRTIEHSEHGDQGKISIADTDAMNIDLGPDTAALEYIVDSDHTTLLVAYNTKSGMRVDGYRIEINQKALNEKVDHFTGLMAARNYDYKRDADDLYRLLIGPALGEISRFHVICIIPNGSLWRLPFHVLAPQAGQPLLVSHTVYYAPSLAYVQEAKGMAMHRAHEHARDLVAFGNPMPGSLPSGSMRGFTAGDLRSLPDAAREAIGIAAIYGPGRSRVYTGTAARASIFRSEAPKYRILHIGTHAILDDHAPMNSALVFMGDSPDFDDGILDAREISSMTLNADLAVLAACDTALGRVDEGEGMLGLSWSFMIAGATTTVVSQWSVDSRATSILMLEFYRRLERGESIAEALRHAALSVRSRPQYAHPFYWAPFISSGDGAARMSSMERR
ncbi:MAG: Tetratricopeptide 2 repeat protein, partial [Gemmatimonadetes bacterium]|nr:Tetratricopeptide 2 repeat protein [Gemmatimonadota bacterium]